MDYSYIPVILLSIIILLYSYFTRTFNYWKNKNVKGPAPIVFFGNLLESTRRRKNVGVVFKEIYDAFPEEKVVGVYRMTTPCLLLRDLDVIKHVMIKDFDTFVDRGVEFSKSGLGMNLFHADGDTWRVLRNRFTPIFTSGKLKNMLYLMTGRGDIFVNYIKELCNGHPTELEAHSLVQKYTLATISACAFGIDLDSFTPENMKTLQTVDKLIFTSSYALELDYMYPGILRKLNSSLFPKKVNEFFDGLVKTVVKLRDGMPTNRKDFMDLLLELRQQDKITGPKKREDENEKIVELTESLIAAQAFVFYAAGYETSATTMSFLLYELANNQDVQDKVIEEIDTKLKNHNGEMTYEMLSELKYLENVVSETLRKFPLVEPLQRNAVRDYKIPGTEVTVKKGQTVLISPFGIQNDEKYYPNPEKFDPDRFNPENSKDRHPCAYLPFGVGPRNCIGMRFAKLQSHICIAKLLSNFRVVPSKKTMVEMEFDPKRPIMGPNNGVYLTFVPRDI
ncbi:PREDICTED: cytochrome P450 6B5-like [Papilio polytes]|uniref:cytochrome P450 6B5-like n=1 Tax=Papilio polytes TaxID=76194 RepID=UPI0006769A96|nr:PREDICTED: cytochrome P450 6B5-like [Papilio polytes]